MFKAKQLSADLYIYFFFQCCQNSTNLTAGCEPISIFCIFQNKNVRECDLWIHRQVENVCNRWLKTTVGGKAVCASLFFIVLSFHVCALNRSGRQKAASHRHTRSQSSEEFIECTSRREQFQEESTGRILNSLQIWAFISWWCQHAASKNRFLRL